MAHRGVIPSRRLGGLARAGGRKARPYGCSGQLKAIRGGDRPTRRRVGEGRLRREGAGYAVYFLKKPPWATRGPSAVSILWLSSRMRSFNWAILAWDSRWRRSFSD